MLLALVLAAALPPAASPSPKSDCADVGAISFEDAFGHEVRDVAALRLVAALSRVPPERQSAYLTEDTSAHGRPVCLTQEAGYAAARALTLIANLWKPDLVADDAKFATLSQRVEAAFAAPVPPAAFAGLLSPSTTGKPACATPNQTAATLTIVNPQYTAAAIAARTTGGVETSVYLDATGFVRSAHLYGSTVGDTPEALQLKREALLGAAATTYRPACVAGHGVPGKYLFVTRFTGTR